MTELKISIPEEIKRKMEKIDLDWPNLINEFIIKKIDQINEIEAIISRSELTEEDALELGNKVNQAIFNRFKKLASK